MPFDGTQQNCALTPEVELLDCAMEVIRIPRLWCKETEDGPNGRHCILGALMHVEGRPHYYAAVEAAILRAIADRCRPRLDDEESISIADFNDLPSTRHRDVMAVLRQARQHLLA